MILTLFPFKGASEEILIFLKEALPKRLPSLSCKLGPPLSLPPLGFDPLRGQWQAEALLTHLAQSSDPTSLRLGVTGEDLYSPGLNFVFGLALIGRGLAIFSYHRLRESFYGRPDNQKLLYLRALKEALHELGHALGLRHCHRWCVMRFSNCLEEVDEKPDTFCSNCLKRLGLPPLG